MQAHDRCGPAASEHLAVANLEQPDFEQRVDGASQAFGLREQRPGREAAPARGEQRSFVITECRFLERVERVCARYDRVVCVRAQHGVDALHRESRANADPDQVGRAALEWKRGGAAELGADGQRVFAALPFEDLQQLLAGLLAQRCAEFFFRQHLHADEDLPLQAFAAQQAARRLGEHGGLDAVRAQ